MTKIVAEVSRLGNGVAVAHATAFNPDGSVSEEVTATLLDLVEQLHPPLDEVFNVLLDDAAAGQYEPIDPAQPDFSINVTCVWLRAPWVQPGEIMISHEYVPSASSDEGKPQTFTIQQFRDVLSLWKTFMKKVDAAGLEASVGHVEEMHI